MLARSRRKLPKGGELRHGVGGCETTQSIYQQPSSPTTKKCLPIQSQHRQANSPTGSELVQRLWLVKGIYFANPRIQWVEMASAQMVTRQKATLDRISTPARRTWPERISASVCRLILILFQVELTIHGHAVMLLTRSMSGETPTLPYVHMAAAWVCGRGIYERRSAQWERRGPPRPVPGQRCQRGRWRSTLGMPERANGGHSSSD